MKRTKLVCTVGPACDSEDTLRKMIHAGANVIRINFSHGDSDYHKRIIRRIMKIRKHLAVPVAILQDLQGPKIRIGKIAEERAWLERGAQFTLTSEDIVGDASRASVPLPGLAGEVAPGHRVLLADGRLELRVERIAAPNVICRVVVGGMLSSHKGVNFPAAHVAVEALSSKDLHDLRVGLAEGVDAVALSFVRSAKDIELLRSAIREAGAETKIIAKIEKPQAVHNITEILEAADGVMIARGDLGIEIDLAEVPLVQKKIIREANRAGKPVITATQMLVGMVDALRPTRAEVANVANAILDGTDAVMLSEETAAGQYPVESVQMIDRIARGVEGSIDQSKFTEDSHVKASTHNAITRSSCNIARAVGAAAIVTPTWSGSTARLVARFRPKQPIIATTPNAHAAGFLAFCWGVTPVSIPSVETIDEQLRFSVAAAVGTGFVRKGQLVVITGGTPLHLPGTTNFIQVERVP